MILLVGRSKSWRMGERRRHPMQVVTYHLNMFSQYHKALWFQQCLCFELASSTVSPPSSELATQVCMHTHSEPVLAVLCFLRIYYSFSMGGEGARNWFYYIFLNIQDKSSSLWMRRRLAHSLCWLINECDTTWPAATRGRDSITTLAPQQGIP